MDIIIFIYNKLLAPQSEQTKKINVVIAFGGRCLLFGNAVM